MPDATEAPNANQKSWAMVETPSSTDSNGLYHESSRSGAKPNTALEPAIDIFPIEWDEQIPEQQQQPQHNRQDQYPQQYMHTQQAYHDMAGQVPGFWSGSTFTAPTPALMTGTQDTQPTTPDLAEWYLSQSPYNTSVTSLVDNQSRRVESLPYPDCLPPTEAQTINTQRREHDVAASSSLDPGHSLIQHDGRFRTPAHFHDAARSSEYRVQVPNEGHGGSARLAEKAPLTNREKDCLKTVLLMDSITKHYRAGLVMQEFGYPQRSRIEYRSLFRGSKALKHTTSGVSGKLTAI